MKKPVKNVLIVAARYSNNLGDDILFDVVLDVCKKARGIEPIGLSISGRSGYVKNSIEVSVGKKWINGVKKYLKNTNFFSAYVRMKGSFCLRKNLRELNWAEFDTVVFAGGQLFMDYFVPWIAKVVSYAEKYKKKVVFNCCGMGKLSSQSIRTLKRVFKSDSIRAITLRDGLDKFNTLFKNNKVIQTVDPAVNSIQIYGVKEKIKDEIGIGIISYKMLSRNAIPITEEEYIILIKQIVELLESKHKKVKVFTNGAIEDQEYAKFLLKKIGKKNLLKERPIRPIELVDIVASCEQIISFRLHSLILAASYNIPSIGFIWDLKVKEFFRVIEKDEWAIPINKELSIEKIKLKIERLININEYKTKYKLQLSYDYLEGLLKE